MSATCRICGEESILNEAGVCNACQIYRPTHNCFGQKVCAHGTPIDQECPFCKNLKR